jgi:hypothetical protein
MKKLFFLFALLASIVASASVTVTPLTVNYNAKTVTFRVEYANAANNRAWVWIDLCPVSGVTTSTFQTAVINAVSATSGSVDAASLNGRGFYVTTSPSTVTATLSNASGKFNWCAYGSDYPPNAVAYSNGAYTLKGTKPFVINGATVDAKIYAGVINSMTDATGCPGGVGRDAVHNGGTCAPGLTAVGSYCRDLTADDAEFLPACGIEKKKTSVYLTYSEAIAASTNGWHLPSVAQIKCFCSTPTTTDFAAPSNEYVSSGPVASCVDGMNVSKPGWKWVLTYHYWNKNPSWINEGGGWYSYYYESTCARAVFFVR